VIINPVAEGLPFAVGTRPLGSGDEAFLSGRDREISDLAAFWGERRLTVLYGRPGVGKTSLVCGGVMPRLRAQGKRVLPLGRLWRRNAVPAAAFPEQNVFSLALLTSWYPDESPTRIVGLSALDFLRGHGSKDRFGLPVDTFAAIDQAEVLFREPVARPRQRDRFLDQLAEVMDAELNLHLLLVVREEHLEELRAFGDRVTGDGHPENAVAVYELGAFHRDAAVRAVRKPLAAAGRDPGPYAAALVDELRTIRTPWEPAERRVPPVAPALLQQVCARLWAGLWPGPSDVGVSAARGAPGPLDAAGEAAGRLRADVDDVLTEFCGQTLDAVAADHRMSSAKLVSCFRDAVAEHGGGELTHHALDEAVPPAVWRAMEDLHLVRACRWSGATAYQLNHPRLIEPVLRLGTRQGSARRLGTVHRPEPPELLRAAERALSDGNLELAAFRAEAVIRACGKEDVWTQAVARRLLGNIAYEDGRPDEAGAHYRAAASLFELLQDAREVGLLLAAIGRLLMDDRAAEAVRELRAAVNRLPHDPVIQTVLAQALWQAGQPAAALAVLDTVLNRDGSTSEALRARGEMLADLGRDRPAIRDLRRIDHTDRPSTRAALILAETSWRLARDAERAEPRDSVDPHTLAGGGETQWPDPATQPVEDLESGPVLLRLARARGLRGDDQDAADLAAQAVAARRPPLPPQLRDEARRLMGTDPRAGE
jgi:tetratricopeptide (TPR) repeat protein